MMKRIIFVATALLLFGVVNAQKVKFGFKAGVNIATQRITLPNSPGINFDKGNVIGVNVGFFVDLKLVPKLFFQPELLYSMQGAKLTAKINGVSGSAEDTATTNYLIVPLTVKYYINNELNLQAGPQVGFLLSANDKVVSSIQGLSSSSSDSKSSYNTIDFGLNFGLGYDITKNISLSGRYNLGLSDLEKTLPTGYTPSKNRVLSFSLGYKF